MSKTIAQIYSLTNRHQLHEAVRLLRERQLGDAYEQAWDEWAASEDADAWDRTSGEGLTADAAR